MMKKIIILANDTGGLLRFRGMLIKKLMEAYNVFCAIPYSTEIDKVQKLCTKTIDIPMNRRGINPIHDFGLMLKYYSLLAKEKPDYVITYTIKPNIYGGLVCRFLKIPYAVNVTGLGTAFEKKGMLQTLVTIMNRLACKKAKVVFFENEYNRRFYVDHKIINEKQSFRLNGAGVDLNHI